MIDELPTSTLYNKSKSGTEWMKYLESIAVVTPKKTNSVHVRLLPRRDISLYGFFPKTESRVFLKCTKCSKIVLASGIENHITHYHSHKRAPKKLNPSKRRSVLPRGAPPPPLFPEHRLSQSTTRDQIQLFPSFPQQIQAETSSPFPGRQYASKFNTSASQLREQQQNTVYKSKSGAEWIKYLESISAITPKKTNSGHVRLLPRKDISLYGIYPKMESRVFLKCTKCSKLTLASGIENHITYYHSRGRVLKKRSPNKRRSVLPRGVPLPPLFPEWFPQRSIRRQVQLSASFLQQIQAEASSAYPGHQFGRFERDVKKAKKQAQENVNEE